MKDMMDTHMCISADIFLYACNTDLCLFVNFRFVPERPSNGNHSKPPNKNFTSVATEGKSEKSALPANEESNEQKKNDESLIAQIDTLTKKYGDVEVSFWIN